MSDFGLVLVDNCIQLQIANGDFVGDEGLETAVLLSLFTDQRVDSSELPPGLTDKRGWWGDMFPNVQGDQIGSKLWVLDRSKTTDETLAAIETNALNALNWMLVDGVASSVSVTASYNTDKSVSLVIEITEQTGNEARFSLVWDGQAVKRA